MRERSCAGSATRSRGSGRHPGPRDRGLLARLVADAKASEHVLDQHRGCLPAARHPGIPLRPDPSELLAEEDGLFDQRRGLRGADGSAARAGPRRRVTRARPTITRSSTSWSPPRRRPSSWATGTFTPGPAMAARAFSFVLRRLYPIRSAARARLHLRGCAHRRDPGGLVISEMSVVGEVAGRARRGLRRGARASFATSRSAAGPVRVRSCRDPELRVDPPGSTGGRSMPHAGDRTCRARRCGPLVPGPAGGAGAAPGAPGAVLPRAVRFS